MYTHTYVNTEQRKRVHRIKCAQRAHMSAVVNLKIAEAELFERPHKQHKYTNLYQHPAVRGKREFLSVSFDCARVARGSCG